MVEGGSLENPVHVIKDAVELAPVEVKFDSQCSKLVSTSMDNSLKVYNLETTDSFESKLVLDSNIVESSTQIDPWKVCFNPKNSGQIITGQ
jgi:hypothetical protein